MATVHRLVKEFVDKGSHSIIVATVDKGPKPPRSYEARCKTAGCGWTSGGPSTGSAADAALIEHRNKTLADAGADLVAIGAVAKPKAKRGGKAKAQAPVADTPETPTVAVIEEVANEA